jgi:addiction module antitoxin, relB/dinJ family
MRGDYMENLSCVINVQVDSKDKEAATKILKDLGLNMSTFINMAIKQVIKKNGVPFEVRNPYPSVELLEALEESNKIINEIKEGKRTGFSSIEQLVDSLDED